MANVEEFQCQFATKKELRIYNLGEVDFPLQSLGLPGAVQIKEQNQTLPACADKQHSRPRLIPICYASLFVGFWIGQVFSIVQT